MFLNTEAIHSEPQRHISGNSPVQTPHSPLFIPLSAGWEPERGAASAQAAGRAALHTATHNSDLS